MQQYISVLDALGAEQAGSLNAWYESLEKWAIAWDEADLQAEVEARRHDPTYRPPKELAAGQLGLMSRGGGEAPVRESQRTN